MNLRLNKKLLDNSVKCKACEAVYKFLVYEFKYDLASVIPTIICDNVNFVVCEVDENNNIINYTKTPNEVMSLLFKYGVLEKTKELEGIDFSKIFLMHLATLSKINLKLKQ